MQSDILLCKKYVQDKEKYIYIKGGGGLMVSKIVKVCSFLDHVSFHDVSSKNFTVSVPVSNHPSTIR